MKTLCVFCHVPGVAVAAAIAVSALPTPALGQGRDRTYDIIAPEPWLPPKHRSIAKPLYPSGSAGIQSNDGIGRAGRAPKAERIPKSVPLAIPQPQQPTFVPGLGNVPNLPPARGLGATESFNDRAIRCSHQSGLYGVPAGQTGTYIRTCAN